MRYVIDFMRYAIDTRAVKRLVLVCLVTILSVLVGCRAQQKNDADRFERERAEIISSHEKEMSQLRKEAENGIYATQYLSSKHEGDAWKVAQWLDCLDERYQLTPEAKALACWVIFNRVDSVDYPDNVEWVLWQDGQFDEYSDSTPPTEGNIVIATNQVSRWKNGDIRPCGTGAVYITVTSDGVELRDAWEADAKCNKWRA